VQAIYRLSYKKDTLGHGGVKSLPVASRKPHISAWISGLQPNALLEGPVQCAGQVITREKNDQGERRSSKAPAVTNRPGRSPPPRSSLPTRIRLVVPSPVAGSGRGRPSG
jgi:hypothetical protein